MFGDIGYTLVAPPATLARFAQIEVRDELRPVPDRDDGRLRGRPHRDRVAGNGVTDEVAVPVEADKALGTDPSQPIVGFVDERWQLGREGAGTGPICLYKLGLPRFASRGVAR